MGISGGNRQTIAGTFFTGSADFSETVQHKVNVSDGDVVVLHDDQPKEWKQGDHAVLLLHGLSGCHGSGYMMRIANKLNQQNVRSFRMDHRGCGAGDGLAQKPYHAGRIDDLHRVIASIETQCPGSSVSVVGFSLSGNLLLRYLGDPTINHSSNLFRAVAVCPPVDLGHCVRELDKTKSGQQYDRYFTRQLVSQISGSSQWRDDVPLAQAKQPPRRLYDFDDMYTAPASGFGSADEYYHYASSSQYIGNISVPSTILAAKDDPLVSSAPFHDVSLPSSVSLCMTEHGGHLGYIGRRNEDPDRHWMDWRVIEWLLH
jgi:predicted alpha/beta-fold hydrolase